MSTYDSKWCSARSCFNRRKEKHLSFFRFPPNPERCKQWLIAAGREDLLSYTAEKISKNYVLCAEHFTVDQFLNPLKRHRLIWSAVPTLFEKPNLKHLLNKKFSSNQPDSNFTSDVTPIRFLEIHHSPTELGIPASSSPFSVQKIKQQYSQKFPQDNLPQITDVYSLCNKDTSHKRKREYDGTHYSNTKRVKQNIEDPIRNDSRLSMTDEVENSEKNSLKQRRLRMILYKYRVSLQRARSQMEEMQSSFKELEKFTNRKVLIRKCCEDLKEPARTFFVTQFELMCSNRRKKCWTEREKQILLALYYSGRKAYGCCQKIFRLPSPKTLRDWTSIVEIDTGFCEIVKSSLSIRSQNLSEIHRLCLIMFDEISLKTEHSYNIADDEMDLKDRKKWLSNYRAVTNVLVFMVKGLTQKWQQLLGYFFSSGTITGYKKFTLIKQAMDLVNGTGLKVTGIVCNDKGTNKNLPSMFGVSEEKPYFIHNCSKIFFFFDADHLLTCFRNNFKKYNLFVDNSTAKWEHIATFYKQDSEKKIRLVPELKFSHVYLPILTSSKTNLADNVFSYKLGAALSCLSSYGVLPSDAKHTAEIILTMKDWHNCFVGKCFTKGSKNFNTFSTESKHRHFLEQFRQRLRIWKFDSNTYLTTLNALKLTANSVLELWEYLKDKFHAKLLLTSRLNQDIVESLSSNVTGKREFRGSLTPSEFQLVFKETLINSLLLPIGYNANSKNDYDNLLICFSD